ncbi:tyrosine-type recombinase/integrase [Marinibacterium sp. SX1]|uniref:tyrosine-type recombinase/integrase n=1 Tax=Marinibacterium sp. SX1 TaxID=3388424 RepID=UPI003D16F98A
MRNKLTAIEIKNAGDGKLFDGGGLTLVKKGERGKWVFRYSHLGKRREMGIGAWPDLALTAARKERDRWAAELARGVDPIDARRLAQDEERQARDKADPTFAEMVDIVFDAKRDGLRGDGKRGRWRSPLDGHVVPKIGRLRMTEIDQVKIRDAIAPIWRTKHPTAIKAIQRTRIIFEEARYAGIDCDPFVVDAARRMLGEVRHQVEHIAATPWQEIPDLWARLDPDTASGLCLRWMLLTLVRFDGCHRAKAAEVDDDGVWTVPAERVKGREGQVQDFRVPLPQPAIEIVAAARAVGHDFLFPGPRGAPVGSRAVELYLDRIGERGRPHGFRTAFRTWVQDSEICTFDVAETILGHRIGGRIERSYARSDLLDRRRPIMASWAAYVTGEHGADVVTLLG